MEPGVLISRPKLEKYELLNRLASGGMGDVWLARAVGPAGFEKLLVVKTILPRLVGNPRFTEQFLREARLAARLNHPNCVQIFDLGREGDIYYIAMELIDGFSYRKVMRRAERVEKPVPLPVTLKIVLDAASGLSYAHRLKTHDGVPLGLVHRDISPDNMLVTFTGQTKLVDFGIAKATNEASDETTTGHMKGKWRYMAPEYLMGLEIDGRADLFALGVVLYQGLTGYKPFTAPNEMMIVKAVLDEEAVPPTLKNPELDPVFDEIIAKALAKKPDDRYDSARTFRKALTSLKGVEPADHETVAEYLEELWPPESSDRKMLLRINEAEIVERTDDAPLITRTPSRSDIRTAETLPARSETKEPTSTRTTVDSVAPGPAEQPSSTARIVAASVIITAALTGLVAWGLATSAPEEPTTTVDPVDEPAEDEPAEDEPAEEEPEAESSEETEATPELDPEEPSAGATGDTSEEVAAAAGSDEASPTMNDPGADTARVSLTFEPAVDVSVGRRRLGRTPLTTTLPVGRHTLLLRNAERHIERRFPVTVVAGRTTLVRHELEHARVHVRVSPWAEVSLDGRALGQTPIPPQDVFAGRHVLVLSNSELGATKRVVVDVRPGQTRTVREILE